MKSTSRGDFSAHRQAVMGIAIALIMLCHNQVWFWREWVNQLNTHIRAISQIGVDMFLFCSGFGLYFSYTRTPDLGSFYRKRMVRILPAYFIMLAVWTFCAWYYQENVYEFLRSYSLLSFFTRGELIVWYVPAILLLYLLYPLAFRLTQSKKALILSCGAIWAVSFVIALMPSIPYALEAINEVLIVRVPVFLLGAYWGRKKSQGISPFPRSTAAYLTLFCVLTVFFLISMHIMHGISWWWVNRLLFCPMTLCLLGLLLPCLERTRGKGLYRFFVFLGTITLELYLIQERLLVVLNSYILFRFDTPFQQVCVYILSVVLAIALSFGLHKLCTLLFQPGKTAKRKKLEA